MIQYKVGQEVYHARFGRGIVQDISDDDPPIICVDFGEETKKLVYDKNLLLRMTIRGVKPISNSKGESEPSSVSSKTSFVSSLVHPDEVGINQGKAPSKTVQVEGHLKYVCPTCGSSFMKAKRCPECGQLILYDIASSPRTSKKILRVGDDVSRLRIYEIINKFFGKNYTAWMKASYDINDDYWAWFPTITANNVRPGGSYGGTAMWSNTLSPDMKTVISMNHDATIDDIPRAERNNDIKRKSILIFERINGVFKFLGVFDDKLVLENKTMTYRHDRLAKGIDLDTFQLIDED